MNGKKLFLAGFTSFLLVNFIENLLYYSIGRSHGMGTPQIFVPSARDLLMMIAIMFFFAALQALLTNLIDADILQNS